MPDHIFYTMQKAGSPFLDKRLLEYAGEDWYPFHMPGHKRTPLEFPNPYSIDITEIEGFDNLHHARGILRDAQERAAALYGAQKSFFLVNGSTSGILAAISAAIPRGGVLLMSRNSHKAAYHAAYLRELETVYLLPSRTEFGISGSIQPAHVAQALEDLPQIGGVFITSPTYDGVLSDIQKIAGIAHAHNVPLIVDEAHGAHLAFSSEFPDSALQCGADVVVQSLHKTLPCLTQAALLHVNSNRICLDALRRFLGIYQTSSPSYLLMASIEQCIRYLKKEGREQMARFAQLLRQFYKKARTLRRLKVFEPSTCPPEACFAHDFSKILVSTGNSGLTGKDLYDALLNGFHLQMEMSSGHYTTALASLMDTPEGFLRLSAALEEIDKKSPAPSLAQSGRPLDAQAIYQIPKPGMSISKALECPSEALPLKGSIGHISQEYIYLYPPGIPLATPGEILTGSLLSIITQCQRQGLPIEGPADIANNRIRVVKG
jgi:arginine decarboxylase